MCRPNASVDDILDHLEHRDRKIRQSLSLLKVNLIGSVMKKSTVFSYQVPLKAVADGKMLSEEPMT